MAFMAAFMVFGAAADAAFAFFIAFMGGATSGTGTAAMSDEDKDMSDKANTSETFGLNA